MKEGNPGVSITFLGSYGIFPCVGLRAVDEGNGIGCEESTSPSGFGFSTCSHGKYFRDLPATSWGAMGNWVHSTSKTSQGKTCIGLSEICQGCCLKQNEGEPSSWGWEHPADSKLLHSFFKGPRGLQLSVQSSTAVLLWGLKLRALPICTMFLTRLGC